MITWIAKKASLVIRYVSCEINIRLFLYHEITLDEGKAKFDSGLLTITVPFRKPVQSTEIPIEWKYCYPKTEDPSL